MVLGLRTKTRRSPLVQLEYIIHLQEIKPWPPSQSLRTLRAVLIQWDHADNSSGFTNQAVPSLGTGSGVGDGRIEFNHSFKLPVTLMRETSFKGGDGDTYQKNCIEFNLYEPRRDKVVKGGQLLGSAVLDLAVYGVIKENLSISAPINCKRTYRNAVQPLLFLKIQPVETNRMVGEASMDRNHGESVSALMSEEYAEEAEVASFTTDDDVSSHPSLALPSSAADSSGSSSPLNKKNETTKEVGSAGYAKVDRVPHQFIAKPGEEQASEYHLNSVGNSSYSSSMDLSCDITWVSKRITSQSFQSPALKETKKQQNSGTKGNECGTEAEAIQENVVPGERGVKTKPSSESTIFSSTMSKESTTELIHQTDELFGSGFNLLHDDKNVSSTGTDDPRVDIQKQVTLEDGLVSNTKESGGVHSSFPNIDRSKDGKSSKSSGSTRSNHSFGAETGRGSISSERKDTKAYKKETRNFILDSRVHHLENRIKILEGELREAAAIEVSLYSVVAEHGSSMNKVHAPARRLSRLYFHANKQNPKSGKESAAKSIVSGLVLVAKACGNDVPRLTFWLSNAIVLRVITESSGHVRLPISGGRDSVKVGDKNGKKKASQHKLESFPSKSTRGAIEGNAGDRENHIIFVTALEKIETWIFSRIIESLWWQTFTPHMQSGAAKAIRTSMDSDSSKSYRRISSSIEQQQGNFSLELWKKAFRDACERICPVRAGGHECGCLSVLSRLIMEQLIARLDVAMFNAILREAADEIPTDPVADPISDAKVLPIPAGKASFGAGAQLKNAIGNWSRWLTDLFGMDDDDDDNMLENENTSETAENEEKRSRDTSPKPFHLLNSLSDLMMLPKDMLLSPTIRKEVCPAFGASVISRILNSFIPDEFCPDPIPAAVTEALNSEDPFDLEQDSIINLPCEAVPIVYKPSSVASVLGAVANHSANKLKRSGSLLLNKSQTSDDELDELASPLKAVMPDNFQSTSAGWIVNDNGATTPVKYQLLREVWRMDG